jgi:catechol-2,3-dioxygenase
MTQEVNALSDHRPSAIRTLGEVALRVNDLQRMRQFYEDTLGLETLGEFPTAVLLRVAEDYGGHTQALALFDRSVSVSSELTTIDHLAFTIDLDDYESERRRLEGLGLEIEVRDHAWVKWRSLYFHDPEGNQVELVCYDPDLS